jgi:predicted porin
MMKSLLTMSALAFASATALAQSSVTLYGIVDGGVVRTTGLATNKTHVVSGIMEGSRLGFRGNEDLGGGWRALFTLEQRLELNSGTFSNRPPTGSQTPDRLNQAALLGLPAALQPAVSGVASQIGSTIGVNLPNSAWDRQIFVGLVTPVGGVLLGRQYTPAYEMSATFDTLGTYSSLSAGQVASVPASIDIRVSNALQYRIVYGGITASAMYALGGVTGNSKASRFGGAMVMYRGTNFAVGIGYNQRNNDIGQESLKSLVVGGSLNIGPGTAYLMGAQVEDDAPSGVASIQTSLMAQGVPQAGAFQVQRAFTEALKQDGQLLHAGYKFVLGNVNTIYVAYSSWNDKRAPNADVSSYGIVLSHALSKRTDINLAATHFDNRNLAQAAPGQAGFIGGFTKSAGTDSNSLALGVRHRF